MPIARQGQGLKDAVPLAQVVAGVYARVAGRINAEGGPNMLSRTIADEHVVLPIRPDVSHRLPFHNPDTDLAGMIEQNQVKVGAHGLKTAPVVIRAVIRGTRSRRTPTHAVAGHTQKAGLFHLRSDTQKVEQGEDARGQGLPNLVSRKTALLNKHDPIAEARELMGDGRSGRTAASNHDVCCGRECHVRLPIGNRGIIARSLCRRIRKSNTRVVSISSLANLLYSRPGICPLRTVAMRIASVLSRFYRLSPFVKPYVRRIGFVFLLSSFGTVLGLLWPLFTKILIDDVLLARNMSLLVTLCGIMLGVTLLGYGVGAVNRYLYTQVTARVLFALRQHLFAHLQKLSLRFHTQVKVGDLLSRLNTDIAEIQSVLTDAAFTFVTNIFVLLATVGFLIWLNWRLFLVSLLVIPIQIYGVRKIQPYMVEETRKVRELNASISAFLVESLSAIKFVKQFGAERTQLGRLGRLGQCFVALVTRFEMIGYIGSTTATATTFLGSTLVTLYGGYLVIEGQMSIGSLVAFAAYQSRAFSPIQVLMDLYLRIERAGVSVDRVFEFLDIGQEYTEPSSGTLRLEDLRGEIEFRDVSFDYQMNAPASQPVLQRVSFRVGAGRRLTVLGRAERAIDALQHARRAAGRRRLHRRFERLRGGQHPGRGDPARLPRTGRTRRLRDLVVQPAGHAGRGPGELRRRLSRRGAGLLPPARARYVGPRCHRRSRHSRLRRRLAPGRRRQRGHHLRRRGAYRSAHRRPARGVRAEPVPDLAAATRRRPGPAIDDPLALRWWKTAKLADHPWLAPAADAAPRGMADYPVSDAADARDAVERCRALVESRGMEFLALDQTRPDIGMPVVRVIVPGLRHFWERFAPGRLYDVPVETGRRDRALAEDELNSVPVIA